MDGRRGNVAPVTGTSRGIEMKTAFQFADAGEAGER